MQSVHRSAIYQYAFEIIRPTLLLRDKIGKFDRDLWEGLASNGVFAANQTISESVSVFYHLGKGSLDIPFGVSAIAQWIGIQILKQFGNDRQKDQFLDDLQRGKLILAVCNSEVAAGTDIKAIQSSLTVHSPKMATLDIQKRGATNLTAADLVLSSVWRKEDGTSPTLEVVFLEKHQYQQESIGAALMGFKTGMTGSLKAFNLQVDPQEVQLGPSLTGYRILKFCFNLERLLIASLVAGVLEGILENGIFHLKTRKSMDKPLSEHQYMQEKIIQIATIQSKLYGLLKCVLEGLSYYNSLEAQTELLAILKISVIEDAALAFRAYFEIFGFASFTEEHVAQKLLRDHLALTFLGGTKEQQKIILFSELAKKYSGAPQQPSFSSRNKLEPVVVASR